MKGKMMSENTELNYARCPEDDGNLITCEIGQSRSGKPVLLGIPEIATSLFLVGSTYGVTLAIKTGVSDDFIPRCAAGLALRLDNDVHALCPILSILIETSALMHGGKMAFDKDGQVEIFPSDDCPAWMKGYFNQQMESPDDDV